MGYYNKNYPPNPHRKKRRGWLVPAMLGVIIGILLVVIGMPAFTGSSILPDQRATQDESDEATIQTYDNADADYNIENRSVNVDVSTQITDVVEEVTPAVVGVINLQGGTDYWQQEAENEAGTGSGVIYKNEGGTAFVVTNQHVVAGADTVEVVLSDETHIEAEIIGGDLFSDLAVLRMDGSEVQAVIEVGSSDNVKVGEPAIAIGNPLGMMFSSSVTTGVISGTQRTIPQDFNQDGRADWQAEVIQTDAAINPGNSGGALINIYGQLIGINSMKINEAAVEGIGFAIPVETAMPTIQELEETGEVVRPYLGVEIYSLEEVPRSEWDATLTLPEEVEGGVYVWSLESASPADQAGMERLDVITELDGEPVMDMIDLRKILYHEKEIGDEVVVTYYRDGQRSETTIELGSQ
ncbi:serine protease Do [Virgibacillus natechei]|uniref:Serine protease Do n=1 Tax=Virgibacillus natechei TaxID=1216297 RepID=A0ABS4ILX5_9BACI|nr:trypsin-like peptidase domain-containing protein [Virgibacillus natechei]MBP1971301.1 serine protease Do [Virgibacillus natechei]UZD12963.1 trypsin-like peptidase domain-containing protein [Virgibacillus natechei]